MTENAHSIESILQGVPASNVWLALGAVGLFFGLCWLLCVAAAFVGVKRTPFHSAVITLGVGGVAAVLCTSLVSVFLPDLASEFTQTGLFFFSFVCFVPVVCVPLAQFAWDSSYPRTLAGFFFALCLFFFAWTSFHSFLQPEEVETARITLPVLFQPHP